MKVAIVHYWLVNWRGGELVLAELLELFPEADVFTHVYSPDVVREHLAGRKIKQTFIGKLPWARKFHQIYLPFMPLALEQLDLRKYDLVISCESGPAKGVIVAPDAVHVCYCHSPMRYVWDMYHDYVNSLNGIVRALIAPIAHYMRTWDQVSAQRVDYYIANSAFVANRIRKYYRRPADVIHPPVDLSKFEVSDNQGDFYLFVGQLVAYKRVDLAIRAFSQLKLKLIVIGGGKVPKGLLKSVDPNVKWLGRQPSEVIRRYYSTCRAVVFPGIEDFGIVPIEAMACGKPVIAYRGGGGLETIVEGKTGLFFDEQTPESLAEAVRRFERSKGEFDPREIRRHAESFRTKIFRDKMRGFFENIECNVD